MMTSQQTPHTNPDMPPNFTREELARRRIASRRLAWMLGAVALAIYLIGMFFKR
jgi:hypothetical protein